MPKTPADSSPLGAPNAFRQALVEWFSTDPKDYPWRRTEDPYAILVSEMMLQQTQVATVLGRGFYTRWMTQFPDVATLAEAEEADVLRAWEGLGYYSRARNLQKAARAVMDTHGGTFPRDPAQILALPGVGRYTAGAVASFAFDLPEPLVDANVARVLARLFDLQDEIDTTAGQRQLWDWAAALVPETGGSRDYNSALMELGQRVCRPKNPRCGECPANGFCTAADPASLPRKKPRRATVERDEFAVFAHRDGEILLHRESGRRRQGLWKLPERSLPEVAGLPELLTTKYSITHFRVSLSVHDQPSAEARDNEAWHRVESLPDLAMPSPYRRALDAVLAAREPFILDGT